MHRLLGRLLAAQREAVPWSEPAGDDVPVRCPVGRHDMTVWAPSVYRCDEHGATLVVHSPSLTLPLKTPDVREKEDPVSMVFSADGGDRLPGKPYPGPHEPPTPDGGPGVPNPPKAG
ncbi:hypothetical protein ACO0M4_22200 [Streptomyces sp. RGM 3693]|uniref:hypothetical protein n=1 Tax=Streptomyces sp. RGM 3693 TaxID=3413284 RepID=UPI003D2924C0